MQHYFEAKAHLNMEHFNRQNDITTQNNQTMCFSITGSVLTKKP